MEEYKIVLTLKVFKSWASVQDFIEELAIFNRVNEGIMQVRDVQVSSEETSIKVEV